MQRGHFVISQVQRGAAPALRISRKKVFIKPPHVRDFVKEGYFCVPWYSRSDWASEFAAAKQAENYKI